MPKRINQSSVGGGIPDYISAEEHAVRQRTKAVRSFRRLLGLVSLLALVAVAIYTTPLLLRESHMRGIAAAVDAAQRIQARTWRISPKGERTLFEQVFVDGESWKRLFGGGEAVLLHSSGVNQIYEPGSALLRNVASVDKSRSLKNYIKGLLSTYRRGTLRFTQKPNGETLQMTAGERRVTVDVGTNYLPRSFVIEATGLDGWQKVEECELTYESIPPLRNEIAVPDNVRKATIVADGLTDPTVASSALQRFFIGDDSHSLTSADVNEDGVAYFLIGGLSPGMDVRVYDSEGTRYCSEMLYVRPPQGVNGSSPLYLRAVPLGSAKPKRFPREYHVMFRVSEPGRDSVGEFRYKAAQPTCFQQPRFVSRQQLSDKPYHDYKFEIAFQKIGYLAKTSTDFNGPYLPYTPAAGGGRESARQLQLDQHISQKQVDEATSLYVQCIQTAVAEGVNDSRWLAWNWFNVYELLHESGDPSKARAALQIAQSEINRVKQRRGQLQFRILQALYAEGLIDESDAQV